MGELFALIICIAGLVSYTSLVFILSAGVLVKIVSFLGLGYSTVTSIFHVSRMDASATTDFSGPSLSIVTFVVCLIGVVLATESIKGKRNGRLRGD